MKKRLLAALAALFIAGTSSIFAVGIGAQGGYTIGGGAGGALTFKLDDFPAVFAVDAAFGNYTSIGVTADWWIQNPELASGSVGSWNYFYGVGLAGSVAMSEDIFGLNLGVRAVLGTNVFLFDDFLEFYAQVAYQPTFGIALSGDYGNAGFNWLGFPVNAGFRVWF